MAFFYCTCTINTVSSSHASPTEPSEVGGKACFAPLLHQKICKKFFDVIVAVLQAKLLPAAEEASRVWRSGQFFVSVSEQEKLGTASGSVTVVSRRHDCFIGEQSHFT